MPTPRRTHRQATPREFHVIIERDAEGYYVATVPALRGCHTQAKSLDRLMKRVREAIDLHLTTAVCPVRGSVFLAPR